MLLFKNMKRKSEELKQCHHCESKEEEFIEKCFKCQKYFCDDHYIGCQKRNCKFVYCDPCLLTKNHCNICSEVYCETCLIECKFCHESVCLDRYCSKNCKICNLPGCLECLKDCKYCDEYKCKDCFMKKEKPCSQCNVKQCNTILHTCDICKLQLCDDCQEKHQH